MATEGPTNLEGLCSNYNLEKFNERVNKICDQRLEAYLNGLEELNEETEKALKGNSKDKARKIRDFSGKAFEKMAKDLDDIFKAIAANDVKGSISSSFKITDSLFDSLKPVLESGPFIGSLIGGIGSIFDGIYTLAEQHLFKEKQAEIDERYQDRIDKINLIFEKEIQMRQQNIEDLNKKLSAFTKAFDRGQMTAEEYYKASSEIGHEITQEELAVAKAKKIQKIQTEKMGKKKEYEEEDAKWFSNNKTINKLAREISQLETRESRVKNATTLVEVNEAREGALQRVNKPTLFLAGEAGSEIVAVKPLKAGIDPHLKGLGRETPAPLNQIFNIQVEGFVGDSNELGSRLVELIQSSIRVQGEREFRR